MYAHIPFDRYKSWRAICLRWLIFFTLKQQAYYTDSVYLDYIEDDYYNSVSIYDLILFIAQQSNVLMGKLRFTYSPIVEPFIRDRDEWSILYTCSQAACIILNHRNVCCLLVCKRN